MESLDSAACFMDDLLDLDFGSDIEDDEKEKQPRKAAALPSLNPNGLNVLHPDDPGRSFPYVQEGLEEELEWLSNKDAFPSVETFVDIMSDNPGSLAKQQSPVSVLENSTASSNSNSNSTNGSTIMNCCVNLGVPVRARSKRCRKRRRDLSAQESWWRPENVRNVRQAAVSAVVIGRKCLHCGAEKTPQWRAGPFGPKTLCNACGVRYKSGRLVPEYRPASSPTFSNKLHSNSHRKIVEMRKQKQVMGMLVVKPMDKG